MAKPAPTYVKGLNLSKQDAVLQLSLTTRICQFSNVYLKNVGLRYITWNRIYRTICTGGRLVKMLRITLSLAGKSIESSDK